MPKDKQAIQKMAEELYPTYSSSTNEHYIDEYRHIRRASFEAGYTAAVEDMEKEVVGFAEWLIDTYDVCAHVEPTAADLLTLYRESIKK